MYRRWVRSPYFTRFLAPDDGAGASGGSAGADKTGTGSQTSGEDGKSTKEPGTGDGAKTEESKPNNKADVGGKIEFTPEQQAWVNSMVAQRISEDRSRREEAERTEAAKKQGEYQKLYEAEVLARQKLEADLATEKRTGMIARIASKYGVPAKFRERLKGDTEAELEADAKEIAALLKPQAPDTEAGKKQAGQGAKAGQVAGAGARPGQNGAAQPTYRFQQPNEVPWPE